MKPVASLVLPNGNRVSFYDFHKAALIVEQGNAYTTPAVKHSDIPLKPRQLSAVWRSLAPDTPVPSALASLQTRLVRISPDVNTTAGSGQTAGDSVQATATSSGTSGGGQGKVGLDSPVGCNNGCCDYDWLSGFSDCQAAGSYSWFLYNYYWSYANGTNIIDYDGFVCSASGTSTWSVSIGDGSGGVWSVAQAHYLSYRWVAGTNFWGWIAENVNSSVNSSSNEHLHTYCGHFWYN